MLRRRKARVVLPAIEVHEEELSAVLVGIDTGSDPLWSLDDSLDELERLAQTAGITAVGRLTQKMKRGPDNVTFIGSGKVEELAARLRATGANVVIFDEELSPRQEATLTRLLNSRVMIVDRTALILGIFADHARTREGKLQVELAQLEYELPRLRGKWSHLTREKLGGGTGARFGAGESQLESDRRLLRKRISMLKTKLDTLDCERRVQRKRRQSSHIFRIVLVGYTNAGKSTLLNRLTAADVLAYDKLFATLDATTRRVGFLTGVQATLTDTIGFIQKLPTTLVASFTSTLDEVREADFLLHVIDASSPARDAQIAAVQEVLTELDAQKQPQLMVFNKCDRLEAEEKRLIERRFVGATLVSALTGEGIDVLRQRLERASERFAEAR